MKINQFAIYRIDKSTKGKDLWHLPYYEVRAKKLPIRIEYYKMLHIDEMERNEKANDIWKRVQNIVEVSDVLVMNNGGEISCYYINEDYPRRITGFIRLNPSGALVTLDTRDFKIDGKEGSWTVTDDIIIDGKQFYLMEHQKYRDQVASVILDSYGKVIVEKCENGFDDLVKEKILDSIHSLELSQQAKKQQQVRLEIWQKYYQNGTYERSHESGTEANYDMVDGRVNNEKKEAVKPIQNIDTKKPKKRTSVIKKLHEKQIAIAKRSGKPVPRYLEQQMEAERSRK